MTIGGYVMKTGESRKALVFAAIAGVLVAICLTCIFDSMKVQGTAMEPQVNDGERVLINRIAYLYQKPKVGQIVAVHCNVYSEDGEGSTLIRRIVAIEGDRVKIQDGNFYVNDEIYKGYQEQSLYLEPMDEITIGQNRVFVLGDTKTAVLDSRDQAIGQLRTEELIGKVYF